MAKKGSTGLVSLNQRNAEKLSRLLGSAGGVQASGNPFRDSSFSRIRLAQAPSGGIPARSGNTPGTAVCTQVVIAPIAGSGYVAGDLVKTSNTFTVINWDLQIHGADGDRVIQVSGHSDGSFLVGSCCDNTGSPSDITSI